MNITLNKIGKQYRNEWVFRAVSKRFENGNSYAILGSNGSGKSTFIKIISGFLTTTEGEINYEFINKNISVELIHSYVSIAAPYIDLYDDFTLEEAIKFQAKFMPFKNNFSIAEIIDFCKIQNQGGKLIRDYSSGMKQRVKLTLAILADTPLLLLDEPAMNLDVHGIEWYRDLVKANLHNRLVLIASNSQGEEYDFCNEKLNILEFKS